MRKTFRLLLTANSYNNGLDLSPVQQIICLITETLLIMKIYAVTLKITLYNKDLLLLQKQRHMTHCIQISFISQQNEIKT